MKWLVCVALLVLAVGTLAKDEASGNKMLLGADDTDKKHAEMTEKTSDNTDTPTESIREVKKRVKNDKRQLRELQDRARELKERLRDSKQMSKSEKKELKREFRTAKHDLHNKKMEINSLKSEMKVLKGGKHHGGPSVPSIPTGRKNGKSKNRDGGGRKRKPKMELIGADEKKINNPEQFGLQSEPATNELHLSKKEQKKLMRKMSRKNGRKQKKGRKNGDRDLADISDMMVVDERPKLRSSIDMIPKRPHSGRKHRGRKSRKIACTTDADCHNGAFCFENRKGRKFCKGNGMDKTAGKKCHRSEQCARGLKCFVTTAKVASHHSRKPKGICADPATADLTKGSFIPFKTSQ